MAGFWDLFSDSNSGAEPEPSAFNLFSNDSAEQASDQDIPAAVRPSHGEIFWGMRNLPIEEATKHFLILGMTGSGKSTSIKLFLQSIAPRFDPKNGLNEQLILFDGKRDIVPFLDALGHSPDSEHVSILNPFDKRSSYWNIAEVLVSPSMARMFAALLVPEERGSSAPYFADGARELVTRSSWDSMRRHRRSGIFGTCYVRSNQMERLAQVAKNDSRAYLLVRRLLNDDKHSAGILSTLGTKIGKFEQVAALWHSNLGGRQFSIPEFLSKPGILILGYDPVLKDSIWPINTLLLRALTNEVLGGPETWSPRHWFVLDEFRAMERVDCVHDLLNLGRSKGASVMIGLQSKEGLESIYGKTASEDLLGQCGTKTFLRLGGPDSAEWAVRYFSKVRQMESTVTESWGRLDRGGSIQHRLEERTMFLPSFFMNLPLPKPGGVMVSVNEIPCYGTTFVTRRNFDDVLSISVPPTEVEKVAKREDPKEQKLTHGLKVRKGLLPN